MNKRHIILVSGWALSLGAAYLIGSRAPGISDPSPTSVADAPPTKSSRLAMPSGTEVRDRRALSTDPGVRLVGQLPPQQAVAELARLTDPVARAQGFLALVDSLNPEDFEAVVAEFRSLGITEERFTEYGMLLHAWGQADPRGALAYALENTGTNFARQTILSSWAAYDPEAAIAFAQNNHEGEGANPLIVGIIRGLAKDDLNRATDLMQGMPRSRERGEALATLLPLLLAQGTDQALTWSNGITDEGLRGATQAEIARTIADDDPASAYDLLMTISDQDSQFRALDDVVESWAERDLAGAMAVTEQLDPRLRGEAAEGVIRELASERPVEASDWMASLRGEGVNIDPAIERFMWEAGSKEPALAAEWIGQMSDQRDAERNYHRFLGRWQGRDQQAAQAWMAEWRDELPTSIQRRFALNPDQDQR